MGQPIKTVVSPKVLNEVSTGTFAATPLEWQGPIKDKVSKSHAVYYTKDISQAEIDKGFAFYAASANQLKILLWDEHGSEKWNMCAQEDSCKIGQTYVAALYQTGTDILENVPATLRVRPLLPVIAHIVPICRWLSSRAHRELERSQHACASDAVWAFS